MVFGLQSSRPSHCAAYRGISDLGDAQWAAYHPTVKAAAWFQYGTTISYGSTTPVVNVGAFSSTTVAVSSLVASLSSGILNHCRLVAANSLGTAYGADLIFTTPKTQGIVTLGVVRLVTFSAWW